MKIIDVQRFINKFKLISEAVTLPNIRQAILGKKGMKEYPVIEDDKEWYDEHKDEVLKTIEKALNVDDKTLKIKLQKFDTDEFFTNDKPRKLKVKELLNALRRNFISQVERSKNTEDKTSGIESQYEMMKMENGVEVYAVYTPMANRYLTHTKLWVQGCFSPTWCIASSSANNLWNTYHLYEADFPSVFIVAQKKNGVYNPIKYELKCNPHNSSQFKNGKITLKEWVDEWREPEQHEEKFNETSLFESFKITPEDLQNTIRKLVNSEKSSDFSKKYGKEMLNLYTKKINSGDEDIKMKYLTKACKNGTFIFFCDKIDREDKDYFLDELIRYGTLTEAEVEKMKLKYNEKALLNLIKNKRCTHLSLIWARRLGGNMVRRVFHSLPDEILLEEDDESIRYGIFNEIRDVDGLTTEYVNYLIQKGGVNKVTLNCIRFNGDLLSKCICSMIENDKFDNDIMKNYVNKDDKDVMSKYVDYSIKKGEVDGDTLYYVSYHKELITKCVEYLIKNGEVDSGTLIYVEDDKDLFLKCVNCLIEKGKVDNFMLRCVKNDKKLLTKCVDCLIKKGEVDEYTLNYLEDDKELYLKCKNLLENK